MENEEFKYRLECLSCETIQELVVWDVNERPYFCPMCGDDVDDGWDYKEQV